MNTNLLASEKIIKEGKANLQRGLEAVGGNLYLTNKRLVFESHIINIQRGNTIINLDDTKEITKTWNKFLGFIPLVPNAIRIQTKDDHEFNFAVYNRDNWIAAIKENKGK